MICPDCRTENIPGADFCEGCGQDLRNLDLPTVQNEFTEHLLNDRLGDLVPWVPPVVAPSDPLALAIHLMQRLEAGCVLVYEGDRLVGILTERDVLLKAADDRVDLNAVAVRQIMTPDPVTLREGDTLAVGLHKMSVGGFRRIPLETEDGSPRVVSIRDLFRHISAFIPTQPAPTP